MHQESDLIKMCEIILEIKQRADELRLIGYDFPALDRNLVRLQASLKMLELNICDAVETNALAE